MTTTIITLLVTAGIAAIVARFDRVQRKFPNLLP